VCGKILLTVVIKDLSLNLIYVDFRNLFAHKQRRRAKTKVNNRGYLCDCVKMQKEKEKQQQQQAQMRESVPVIMPGDEMPRFIALPCPCEPLRPEKLIPPPLPQKPPKSPRFPVPLY